MDDGCSSSAAESRSICCQCRKSYLSTHASLLGVELAVYMLPVFIRTCVNCSHRRSDSGGGLSDLVEYDTYPKSCVSCSRYVHIVLSMTDPSYAAVSGSSSRVFQFDEQVSGSLVSRLSLVLADVLVVVATCKATYRPYREAVQLGLPRSLNAAILQSGEPMRTMAGSCSFADVYHCT